MSFFDSIGYSNWNGCITLSHQVGNVIKLRLVHVHVFEHMDVLHVSVQMRETKVVGGYDDQIL